MTVIRRLKKSDKKQFEGMVTQFLKWEHWGKSSSSKKVIRLLRHKDEEKSKIEIIKGNMKTNSNYVVLVAEDEGVLKGYICGRFRYNPKMILDRIGTIDAWYVDKKYRDRGIGEMLWKELMKWFRKKKCNRIELNVHPNNKNAVGIYRYMGFLRRAL